MVPILQVVDSQRTVRSQLPAATTIDRFSAHMAVALRHTVEGAARSIDARPPREVGDGPLLFEEQCPLAVIGQAVLDAMVAPSKIADAVWRIKVVMAVHS